MKKELTLKKVRNRFNVNETYFTFWEMKKIDGIDFVYVMKCDRQDSPKLMRKDSLIPIKL